MEEYILENHEILLYEGDVTWKAKPGTSHLVLTNCAIVFKRKFKEGKAFQKKWNQTVDIFPIQGVKTLNAEPQIKQMINTVTVQTVSGILEIEFNNPLAARKFASNLRESITGSATFERGAGKVKGAIGVVDDTLGIDTVDAVKGIVENGVVGTVLGGIKGKKGGKKALVSGAMEIAADLLSEEDEPADRKSVV